MSNLDYDVVVIGTGPGGEGAAMQAAKLGRKVAIIERYERIGGGCTHWGTIPSKALRHAIFKMTDFQADPRFRAAEAQSLSFPELLRTATEVISRQADMRTGFYERNDVDIIHGHARFTGETTLEVTDPTNDGNQVLTFKNAVIATGSRPYRPDNIDFSHPRVFDSDTILNLDETPKSITVLGAGVVGCEYASMFRNLACKVNLINARDKLLAFLDDEIIDALSYHLRQSGVLIRHSEQYESVEGHDDGVVAAPSSPARRSSPTSSSPPSAAQATPMTSALMRWASRPTRASNSTSTTTSRPACPTSTPSATSSASRHWRALPMSRAATPAPTWSRAKPTARW